MRRSDVVGERLASGRTIRSTELWEMSRSCHSATSSSPATSSRGAPGPGRTSRSAVIGFRLCGIDDEPFWPARERLLDLADLGALQVADLGRDRLDRRADRRTGVEVLGVAVPRDDLGRRHRARARAPRRRTPRPRGRCSSRCRPRRTACRPRRRRVRGPQPLAVAVGLEAEERELCRRTSSARRACRGCGRRIGGAGVLERPPLERRRRARRAASTSRSPPPHERRRQRGVDDVGRGEAVVDPEPAGGPIASWTTSTNAATSWSVTASRSCYGVDERGVDDRRPLAAGRGVARRGPRRARPRLDGEQLDLEPEPEPRLVGEQRRHLRHRVAGDHGPPDDG